MSLKTGDRLGPYEVIAPLGAGGMGEVYRATDTKLKREVALKLLPDLFAGDPQRLARFTREALALAALNHPNIAQIYGLEESGGTRALVMELVEGEDLSALIARGPMAVAEILPIARQIAEALEAAHEQGIVHRDLKPANIKLRADGTVKVLDFGLAKAIDPSTGSGGSSADPMSSPTLTGRATQLGVILGTAAYMSPEQAKGMAIDKRVDIWAFGVVVYEMLTGKLLFAGDSVGDTLAAVIRAEIDFDGLPAGTPPALKRLLRRCLERNRKNRLHDIADARIVVDDMIAGKADERSAVPATTPAPRSGKLMALAGMLAVAALAAGWALGRLGPRRSPAAASASQVSFERLTFRPGHFTNARFAPDGQTLFLSGAWEGRAREVAQLRPKAGELPLGLPAGVELLSVSRAGELALLLPGLESGNPYARTGTLAVVSASGGTPRQLAENVVGADWAPDGKSLAVQRYVDGKWRLEYPLGTSIYESPVEFKWIRVSHDGDSVAFFERDAGGDWGVAQVQRSGSKRLLSGDWADWWNLAWSPDGKEIWFGGARVSAASSLYAVDLAGKLRTLLAAPGTLELHDVAPDGTIAAALVTQSDHNFCARSSDAAERDLAWLEDSRVVDMSRDGKQLLLRVISEQETGPAVFLRSMDGEPPVRLGLGTPQELSRDGKWALATRGTEVAALPTAAGQEKVIKTDLATVYAARFLPAENEILVVGRAEEGKTFARVASFDGGTVRTLSDLDLRLLQTYAAPVSSVSPDGRLVAAGTASGTILWPLDGGPGRPLPGTAPNEMPVQWTSDGKGLFVYNISQLPAQVMEVDIASGRRTPWRAFAPVNRAGVYGIFRIVMTPDKSAYAYSYTQYNSSLYLLKGLH